MRDGMADGREIQMKFAPVNINNNLQFITKNGFVHAKMPLTLSFVQSIISDYIRDS